MDVVDEARLEILPHRRHTATDADVLEPGHPARAVERLVDAAGDEVERGAAAHHERFARVVRQHEHGHVIWRFVAPPALPLRVRPAPADRPEHVAAHDPRADVLEAALGHAVVDAGLTLFARMLHRLPDARGEEPLHHLDAVHAEWILQTLVRAGAEAVERVTETHDSQL